MTRKQWKGMGWYAIKGDSYVYLGKGSLQEATDKLIALGERNMMWMETEKDTWG